MAEVAKVQAGKTLHQLESRFVDLNRINCPPTTDPLAPACRITGAPLPKGDSFSTSTAHHAPHK
jgi:hypothetical protein